MTMTPLKTKLIAALLFTATAAGLLAVPLLQRPATADPSPGQAKETVPDNRPVVEAVFVLDTTGSMGGLIQAAKDKIWSVATTLATAQPAPEIRIGLVAYRDRGDDYVTRVVDLTPDIDAVHAELFRLEAEGGGDGPESVNQALHEAVHRISWSQQANAYRVVFLVGDAPPHLDYQADTPYTETLAAAKTRGIRVNGIQCGEDPQTREHWQQIAQLGGGAYLRVGQNGDAVAIATPYDESLARLSAELDDTRLYYGSAEERAARADASAETAVVLAAAPPAVAARRAAFAATESGKHARFGDKELVDEVTEGRVSLDALAPEQLPEPLQGLPEAEQAAAIERLAKSRADIQRRIDEQAAARAEYLRERVAADAGAEASLDHKLFEAIRGQAIDTGLRYDADAPAY